MLRVTIEVLPHAGARTTQVATLEVSNDLTGGAALASYDVVLRRLGEPTTRARVEHYDRAAGALRLAVRALLAALQAGARG